MTQALREKIGEVLRKTSCCDYRVGVGELGLINKIEVGGEGRVHIKVVPCCIFGMARLVDAIKRSVGSIEGVSDVEVDVDWDSTWSPDRMSGRARALLQIELTGVAARHGIKPRGLGLSKKG